jgi:hypothetical protein
VARTLPGLPVEVSPGGSAIAPVEIGGLPAEIEALGRRWLRKVEFHVTVLAESVIEASGGDWEQVARVLAGGPVGPIYPTRELRRVGRHPDKPGLETIVVMVECPALPELFRELSGELGVEFTPPPVHVTLYSTDPEQGIGISDDEELRKRAPELTEEAQEELRRAMDFDAVLGGES